MTQPGEMNEIGADDEGDDDAPEYPMPDGTTMPDPYTSTWAGTVGENVLSFGEYGEAIVRKEPPPERAAKWKGMMRIMRIPDENIAVLGTRKNGVVDYAIDGVRVSWHGKQYKGQRAFRCHTHNVNACAHTRRIRRYREDNPQ